MDYSEQTVRVITGKEAYVHRWLFSYEMQIGFDFLCDLEKDMKVLVTEEGDVVAFNFKYNADILGREVKVEWCNSEAYELFEINFKLSLLSGTLIMYSLN